MTPPKLAPTAAAAAVVAPTTSRRRNTAASDANSCAGDEHRIPLPRRRPRWAPRRCWCWCWWWCLAAAAVAIAGRARVASVCCYYVFVLVTTGQERDARAGGVFCRTGRGSEEPGRAEEDDEGRGRSILACRGELLLSALGLVFRVFWRGLGTSRVQVPDQTGPRVVGARAHVRRPAAAARGQTDPPTTSDRSVSDCPSCVHVCHAQPPTSTVGPARRNRSHSHACTASSTLSTIFHESIRQKATRTQHPRFFFPLERNRKKAAALEFATILHKQRRLKLTDLEWTTTSTDDKFGQPFDSAFKTAINSSRGPLDPS